MSAAINPFPGMHPYLEARWNEVHLSFLVYASAQIQPRLPDDLRAHIGHHLAVPNDSHEQREAYASALAAASAKPADGSSHGVTLAKALLIETYTPELRHLRIIEHSGRLVTVIELFSPKNKLREADRTDFRLRRHRCLNGGISFVQIDLLLQGDALLDDEAVEALRRREAAYHVATHDWLSEETWRLYPIQLQERLPAIEIPLRPQDAAVPLELQPLIDEEYRHGRYDQRAYRSDPPGPLSPRDRAWLDEHLRAQGLR